MGGVGGGSGLWGNAPAGSGAGEPARAGWEERGVAACRVSSQWYAAAAGRDNAEGHGHAHVYVNGMKLGRVYGDWYHIGSLPLGRNEVSVSLYANDHRGLSAGGSKITSTRTVIVE